MIENVCLCGCQASPAVPPLIKIAYSHLGLANPGTHCPHGDAHQRPTNNDLLLIFNLVGGGADGAPNMPAGSLDLSHPLDLCWFSTNDSHKASLVTEWQQDASPIEYDGCDDRARADWISPHNIQVGNCQIWPDDPINTLCNTSRTTNNKIAPVTGLMGRSIRSVII